MLIYCTLFTGFQPESRRLFRSDNIGDGVGLRAVISLEEYYGGLVVVAFFL
jgi:hypothetical protein